MAIITFIHKSFFASFLLHNPLREVSEEEVDGVDEKEELKKVLHALEWIAKMRYGPMLRLFCGKQPCNRRIPHI